MEGLQFASERVVGVWVICPGPTVENAGKVAVLYGLFIPPIPSLSV